MSKSKLINIRIDESVLTAIDSYCRANNTNRSQLVINYFEGLVSGKQLTLDVTPKQVETTPETLNSEQLESLIDELIEEKLTKLNLQENITNAIVKNEIEPLKQEIKSLDERLTLNDNTLEEEHNIAVHTNRIIKEMEAKNNALWRKYYAMLPPETTPENLPKTPPEKLKLTDKQITVLSRIMGKDGRSYNTPEKIINDLLECSLNSKIIVNNKSVYWFTNDELKEVCRIFKITYNSKSTRDYMIPEIKKVIKLYK